MPILTTHEMLNFTKFDPETVRSADWTIRILDLDNCISDDGWRISKIDWNNYDPNGKYEPYHALCPFDECANTHLFQTPAINVIFTGRPVSQRTVTEEWLRRKDVPYVLALFRPERCKLRSVELKEAMLRALIPYSWARGVHEAFDDRGDIVEMYRRNGIPNAKQVCIHDLDAYKQPDGSDVDAEPRAA
jgi:hypothetical protein